MVIALHLPEQLDQRLTNLTAITGYSKNDSLIQALENYLEDMEDLLTANAVLERVTKGKEKTYSADEVRNVLKMEREIC